MTARSTGHHPSAVNRSRRPVVSRSSELALIARLPRQCRGYFPVEGPSSSGQDVGLKILAMVLSVRQLGLGISGDR